MLFLSTLKYCIVLLENIVFDKHILKNVPIIFKPILLPYRQ